MSKGENKITELLTKFGIPFKQEVIFPNLINEVGTGLPVDFVIQVETKLALIEFNGQHHYEPIMEQIESFNNRVRNDITRIFFAQSTGIPLLVIHHKDFSEIEIVLRMFINDVKTKCKKQSLYAKKTIGYFSAKGLSKTAPSLHSIFPLKEVVENTKAIKTKLPLSLTHHPKYGFIQIGQGTGGAIVWTIEQMNAFIENMKTEKVQIENIKIANRELLTKLAFSTKQLQKFSEKELIYQLEIDELTEKNEKMQKEMVALNIEVANLKSNINLSTGKIISPTLPLPDIIRKANQTFTEEFKIYFQDIQQKNALTIDEWHEYLANFNISLSTQAIKKLAS